MRKIEGTWSKNDVRRAFVAGAAWWEFYKTQGTLWPSDRRLAEKEAERRYIELITRETMKTIDEIVSYIVERGLTINNPDSISQVYTAKLEVVDLGVGEIMKRMREEEPK